MVRFDLVACLRHNEHLAKTRNRCKVRQDFRLDVWKYLDVALWHLFLHCPLRLKARSSSIWPLVFVWFGALHLVWYCNVGLHPIVLCCTGFVLLGSPTGLDQSHGFVEVGQHCATRSGPWGSQATEAGSVGWFLANECVLHMVTLWNPIIFPGNTQNISKILYKMAQSEAKTSAHAATKDAGATPCGTCTNKQYATTKLKWLCKWNHLFPNNSDHLAAVA